MATIKDHVSFEFFPPHTAKGVEKLIQTAKSLMVANPEYYSVTCGAGGSTQERTPNTVFTLQEKNLTALCPHISCIGTDERLIKELLDKYKSHKINRIVALRGDMPSGMVSHGDFNYASELIAWIRKTYAEYFHISVGCYPECHPQASNAQSDFDNFIVKAKSGANCAITQYFYNNDGYFHFIEKCQQAGVNIPIYPGIMPITNYFKLARFSELSGAEIPRWIRKQLESYNDDMDSIKQFGIDVVSHMCEELIKGGAPGLHFYTLNNAETSLAICNNLKLI